MNLKVLNKADLNLMVAFQILMEEKNVSRAAERLFISQPAMSKTLKRLRELFNDPLFTRTSHGLQATPRAESLELEVPALLNRFERLISSQFFQPKNFSGRFRIASSDTLSYLFPKLLAEVTDRAPGIKLEHTIIKDTFYDNLRTGKLDFVVHTSIRKHADLVSDKLGSGGILCAMRTGHPLSGHRRLVLKDYLAYPHVRHVLPQITISGLGLVDEVLAQMEMERRIVFETPYMFMALSVISETDCLLVIGDFLNVDSISKDQYHLAQMPAELSIEKRPFVLFHHLRSTHNPAHRWLRALIRKVAASA